MDEKPFSPLFSVGVCVWGGQWLQMTGNKDEILEKVCAFLYHLKFNLTMSCLRAVKY